MITLSFSFTCNLVTNSFDLLRNNYKGMISMSKQVSNHIQNRKGFTGLQYVALNGHDWVAAGSYEVDPYKFNEEQIPEYVQKVESHLKLNHKVWTRILIGEEAILYNWQNDFDTAEDRTRWMIETAITELRDPEKARVIKLRYSVQSLVITANARIKKKDFRKPAPAAMDPGIIV